MRQSYRHTSKDRARLCKQLGITPCLSGVRPSADNALAESFHATVQRETLARRSHDDLPIATDRGSPPLDTP